jgi:hypothetical protein
VGHAAHEGERGHHHGGKRLKTKTFTVSNSFRHEINLASDEDRRGASAPGLVAFLATASCGAASDKNDRLSTLWREVISLASVARSFSKSMVQSISGSGTAMALLRLRVLIERYKMA